MAKYEKRLVGSFRDMLETIHGGVLEGSASASFEAGSDYVENGVQCAVRVYERYSVMGGNRVSMSVTLVGHGEELFLSAITSGGSQAMFWKLNTMGEDSFLEELIWVVEHRLT